MSKTAILSFRGFSAYRLLLGLIAVAFFSGVAPLEGCQRGEEAIRTALAERETIWTREISTLEAQRTALKQRCDGYRGPPDSTNSPFRVRASLDGVGQSIIDVDGQMRQIRPRIEQAIGKGADAAQKALDLENVQMDEYFRAVRADLSSAGKELDSFASN